MINGISYLERSIGVVELNSVGSQVLCYLLESLLESLVVGGKTNKELVGGVGQQVSDLCRTVDGDGAGLGLSYS